MWKDGNNIKWFGTEKEGFNYLGSNQKQFTDLFKHDLDDITAFLKS